MDQSTTSYDFQVQRDGPQGSYTARCPYCDHRFALVDHGSGRWQLDQHDDCYWHSAALEIPSNLLKNG